MSTLTLDTFLAAGDEEARRYRILDGLQTARERFNRNRIYPTLSQLQELHATLQTIVRNAGDIEKELQKGIKKIDIEKRQVIYEPLQLGNLDLRSVEETIRWSLPRIRHEIEAGQTIYNFVDEHLALEEVGIVPHYVEEGYLLAPDMARGVLHVIRYEVSIYTASDEPYRNLKTTVLSTLPLHDMGTTPLSIKNHLMRTHADLPNPATFSCATDLEFPFDETVLPVAKRKLLRQIYS